MPKEINPMENSRSTAYELWMKAPNPMVTFFKTLDVTDLLTVSREKKLKFNMLLCYCITKAAVSIEEFYTLPVGEKLMQYDTIAVSTIVNNNRGGINFCDIPYTEDLETFNQQNRCSRAREKAHPDLSAANRHLLSIHRNIRSAEHNRRSGKKA